MNYDTAPRRTFFLLIRLLFDLIVDDSVESLRNVFDILSGKLLGQLLKQTTHKMSVEILALQTQQINN